MYAKNLRRVYIHTCTFMYTFRIHTYVYTYVHTYLRFTRTRRTCEIHLIHESVSETKARTSSTEAHTEIGEEHTENMTRLASRHRHMTGNATFGTQDKSRDEWNTTQDTKRRRVTGNASDPNDGGLKETRGANEAKALHGL